MLLSFVLRLVPGELLERRIVGRVEVVETGEQASVHDLDELIRFLYAQGSSLSQPAKLRGAQWSMDKI